MTAVPVTAAALFLTRGHSTADVEHALRSLYAAGDPTGTDALAPASLPSDLGRQLARDGHLAADGLEPMRPDGEVRVNRGHAHRIVTADGRRWCSPDEGRVSFDCMIAWQFTSTGSETAVRAAVRLRYYPDRADLAMEIVNETSQPLELADAVVRVGGGGTPADLAALEIAAPGGDFEEVAPETPLAPGQRAFARLSVAANQVDTWPTAGQIEVVWPWGTLVVGLVDLEWLVPPDGEHLHVD